MTVKITTSIHFSGVDFGYAHRFIAIGFFDAFNISAKESFSLALIL